MPHYYHYLYIPRTLQLLARICWFVFNCKISRDSCGWQLWRDSEWPTEYSCQPGPWISQAIPVTSLLTLAVITTSPGMTSVFHCFSSQKLRMRLVKAAPYLRAFSSATSSMAARFSTEVGLTTTQHVNLHGIKFYFNPHLYFAVGLNYADYIYRPLFYVFICILWFDFCPQLCFAPSPVCNPSPVLYPLTCNFLITSTLSPH